MGAGLRKEERNAANERRRESKGAAHIGETVVHRINLANIRFCLFVCLVSRWGNLAGVVRGTISQRLQQITKNL